MTQIKHLKHHERAHDWIATYCGKRLTTLRPREDNIQITSSPIQTNCRDCLDNFINSLSKKLEEVRKDVDWDEQAQEEMRQRLYEKGD